MKDYEQAQEDGVKGRDGQKSTLNIGLLFDKQDLTNISNHSQQAAGPDTRPARTDFDPPTVHRKTGDCVKEFYCKNSVFQH